MQGAYSYASRADYSSQSFIRLRKVVRPFAKVLISLKNYFVRLVKCKSRANAVRVVRVVIVRIAVVVHIAKVRRVTRIRRPQPRKIRLTTYYQKATSPSLFITPFTRFSSVVINSPQCTHPYSDTPLTFPSASVVGTGKRLFAIPSNASI